MVQWIESSQTIVTDKWYDYLTDQRVLLQKPEFGGDGLGWDEHVDLAPSVILKGAFE